VGRVAPRVAPVLGGSGPAARREALPDAGIGFRAGSRMSVGSFGFGAFAAGAGAAL
jgi:hypothetical protein